MRGGPGEKSSGLSLFCCKAGAGALGLLPCAALMSLEADSEGVSLDAAPELLASAMRARGFEQLTPVQQAVLAPEVAGRDLRISSQTGSGKTVAIGLLLAGDVVVRPEGERPSKSALPRALVIA